MSESVKFSNIAATTAAFPLAGGRYGVGVVGTSFGTVALQQVGPDGTTMLDVKAPFNNAGTEADLVIGSFAASGYKVLDLAPGQYKVAITSTTAVYASITRIPVSGS